MFLQVILVGNLGRDPEMRYTPDGKAVTNFSVAVNNRYTTKAGETKEETTWFRVVTWDRMAENCNLYLKKGQRVLVTGRLIVDPATGGPRVWEKDGRHGASFELTAQDVRFLTSKEEAAAAGTGAAPASTGETAIPDSSWEGWGG